MKRIQADWRCGLATEALNGFMRVEISESATSSDFDPRP